MDTEPYHPVSIAIETLLRDAGVWYERFLHAPVITSEEAARVRANDGYTLSHGAKSLIVNARRPSYGKEFIMLVVPGDRQFDKKKVKAAIGYDDLRFATAPEIALLTGGIIRGGVPPWGNLFGIPIFADMHCFDNERMIFNAGDRRVSIAMNTGDYRMLANPIVG